MPGQLLTDWLTIGTAGPTIDGREISEQALQEAAAGYDPKNYSAVVNVDHCYGNLGTVEELRTAKDDQGRTCLQARIRPNDYYLAYNYSDMKLFFSMELQPNFAGTGKTYLTGLAATDNPASLGTTCARFSADSGKTEKFHARPVEAAAFVSAEPGKNKLMQTFRGVLQEFFGKNNNHEGEPDMTKEQFEALQAGNKVIQDAFAKLNSNLEKLTAGNDNATDKTDKTGETPDKTDKTGETPDKTADFAKQFGEQLTQFGTKLNEVSAKLEEAIGGKTGTNFGKDTGAADDAEDFV